MQPGGWVFMLTSVGLAVGLAGWCYLRVLRPPPRPPDPPSPGPGAPRSSD